MIRAEGLVKRYGRKVVLDGVDLEVERGERVAVLGANGAGKTTLLRCLAGLAPFAGRLEVDGLPVGPAGVEARRRIAYAPQGAPAFDLTLGGFVELVAGLRGIGPAGPAACLEALGLPLADNAAAPMRELSGGMAQKAHLALALGSGAPVLLLDEPTASLDADSRAAFVHRIGELDPATTLLFATHRLELVDRLAERLVVLDDGRIVFDGEPGASIRSLRPPAAVEDVTARCAGAAAP